MEVNVISELYNTLTKRLQCVKTEMSLTTCPAKWPKRQSKGSTQKR